MSPAEYQSLYWIEYWSQVVSIRLIECHYVNEYITGINSWDTILLYFSLLFIIDRLHWFSLIIDYYFFFFHISFISFFSFLLRHYGCLLSFSFIFLFIIFSFFLRHCRFRHYFLSFLSSPFLLSFLLFLISCFFDVIVAAADADAMPLMRYAHALIARKDARDDIMLMRAMLLPCLIWCYDMLRAIWWLWLF